MQNAKLEQPISLLLCIDAVETEVCRPGEVELFDVVVVVVVVCHHYSCRRRVVVLKTLEHQLQLYTYSTTLQLPLLR
jgi:hypothetical protein